MRQRTVIRQLLADTIEAEGKDNLLEEICSRVAEGENPIDVAKSMGFSWFVLREWLEDSGGMKRLELAKRCFADGLVWEGLEAARMANSESVVVDKFRAEHYTKMAGKMNREEWGDKQQVEVKNVHQVDIRGLLEAREAKLLAMAVPIEGESSVI